MGAEEFTTCGECHEQVHMCNVEEVPYFDGFVCKGCANEMYEILNEVSVR